MMDEATFHAWIKRIQETEDEEIDCTECFELVSPLVDRELAGKPLEAPLLMAKHHVGQCKVCREEYELLHELAKDEAGGNLSNIDDLRRQIRDVKEE